MGETLMEVHGKEKLGGVPNGFEFFFFERLPETGPAQVMKMIGGVAPLKVKGPNKGEPNGKKMDPATRREVYLPVEEHKAWVAAWEIKTGKCSGCQGSGKTVSGKKECSRCAGSGKRVC
jgi:hypothetical protein